MQVMKLKKEIIGANENVNNAVNDDVNDFLELAEVAGCR